MYICRALKHHHRVKLQHQLLGFWDFRHHHCTWLPKLDHCVKFQPKRTIHSLVATLCRLTYVRTQRSETDYIALRTHIAIVSTALMRNTLELQLHILVRDALKLQHISYGALPVDNDFIWENMREGIKKNPRRGHGHTTNLLVLFL